MSSESDDMKNPKIESRNPKEIRSAKPECFAGVERRTSVSSLRLKTADREFPGRPEPVSDFGPRPSFGFRPPAFGFTLVELLVVIAVIALLAALAMPVYNMVTTKSIIQRAQSERDALETAIGSYYRKYGYYPPGNAAASAANLPPALTNQLYYELVGATNNSATQTFTPLDNGSTISSATYSQVFGVGGIMNCTKGSGDDAIKAQSFLTGRFGQLATNTINHEEVIVLATGANSDPIYKPMPGWTVPVGNANPWRYLYPGVNNPKSYDLWVQIFVAGKTNLICNWKDQPQYGSPMP